MLDVAISMGALTPRQEQCAAHKTRSGELRNNEEGNCPSTVEGPRFQTGGVSTQYRINVSNLHQSAYSAIPVRHFSPNQRASYTAEPPDPTACTRMRNNI
jgi:hypothetical protein